MEPGGAYSLVVPRGRQPTKTQFAEWLTEQVTRRGRHLVIREAEALLKPTGRGFGKAVLSRKEQGGEPPTTLQLFALSRVLKTPMEVMLNMIAADHGLPVEQSAPEPPLSSEAERLARWFDDLERSRQEALLVTLGLSTEDNRAHQEGKAIRKEDRDRAPRAGRRRQ
jgi:hypothetical protein